MPEAGDSHSGTGNSVCWPSSRSSH